MNSKHITRIVGGALILAIVVGIVFLWHADGPSSMREALSLSQVMLVGLALVVALMAGLAIIYSVLELDDKTQALGLPEGSVRSLIAFSLVLCFVGLAAFLSTGISGGSGGPGTKLLSVDLGEITELKTDFIVAYAPSTKDGTPVMSADGKTTLYDATYYPRRNPSADDFAKQIFTTVATVFVSVISFYFGSSTTTSGVSTGGAMAKAALVIPDRPTPAAPVAVTPPPPTPVGAVVPPVAPGSG